jgi:spore maturation protein CgeB
MRASPLGHFPAGKLTTPKPNMKSILTTLAVLGLSVSAFAGCGETTTSKGKLKSFDKDTKSIVIEADGKEVKTKVTAKTKNADGIEKLVGKNVTAVISKHGYAETVEKS